LKSLLSEPANKGRVVKSAASALPLDHANDIENSESEHEQSNEAAQHNADPIKNFAYHEGILPKQFAQYLFHSCVVGASV